ncbi:MAG TPA: alkaline phosphatase family protein [Gaiellaceae bacterium]|nr:alkaline phosphatase family protein [Gaiellaceae bacterium]
MRSNIVRALGLLAAVALVVAVPAALASKPKPKHGVKGSTHTKKGKKPAKPTTKKADEGTQHVFVIVLENHSAASVIGDPNAPFISSLAAKYAVAKNYYGVTHPSLPNYVALLSGSNWWSNSDNPAQRFAHVNLVDQLEAAHKTWAGYMEALPSDKLADSWPSSSNALYASKHNPFVLFDDIRSSQARLANVKPYTQLAADLAKESTTPNFALIVPDQCNDMHGGVYTAVDGHPETPCPYGSANDDANDASLKQKADAFVKGAVDTIMGSTAWKSGHSVIFVVADEGDYNATAATGGWASTDGCCDSPILPKGDPDISPDWPGGVYGGGLSPAVIVAPKGKTGGYTSTTPYNHYSLLSTIEQIFGLSKLAYAADTAQVTPMTEFLTKK